MKTTLLTGTLFCFICFSMNAQNLKATEDMALLNCSVTDFKNNPSPGAIVIFEGEKSKKRFKNTADKTGKFQVLLPEGDIYLVKYANYLDEKSYSKIEIPVQKGIIESDVDIQYEETKLTSFELEVYFETGKSDLTSSSFPLLDQLHELMVSKQAMVIEIAGHTDNVGDEVANLKLSQSRANVITNYLVKKGISKERLVARGYGESQPIANNDSGDGRAKNRRTEVKILKQ